jgi:hypothetical protein
MEKYRLQRLDNNLHTCIFGHLTLLVLLRRKNVVLSLCIVSTGPASSSISQRYNNRNNYYDYGKSPWYTHFIVQCRTLNEPKDRTHKDYK